MPTYTEMVLQTIDTLNRRTGCSYVAIKQHCEKFFSESFEAGIVDWRLKNALKKLTDTGFLKTHHQHSRSYVRTPESRRKSVRKKRTRVTKPRAAKNIAVVQETEENTKDDSVGPVSEDGDAGIEA